MEPTTEPSRYARRLLDAARAGILVAAAAIPFSTALMNIAVAVALACWVLSGQWRATARAIAAEPAAWLGWLLLAALWASVGWSIVPAGQAAGVANKYRELALFGIVLFLFADARWRLRLLWVLFGTGVALLVASFAVQLDLLPGARAESAVVKKSSITHSFMMSVLAYGAAVAALRLQGAQRAALALVALLAALNVLMSVQGRTGYVVLAVLLAWLAVMRWSWKGIAVAIGVAAIAVAAAWQLSPAFRGTVTETETEAAQLEGDPARNSIAKRLHWWKRSAAIALEHPLAGVGAGGWQKAFLASATDDHRYFRVPKRNTHPHSEYAHLAVQLGVGGALLLVALFAAALARAGSLGALEAPLAQGVVIAFIVGCALNDFLLDTTEGHLWAILVGGLFGASLGARERELAPQPR
ncbi:MAG TPA: O-antigen ligase family protein [Burkholderiales bacterium]|nr:O-antigen ligase family protein [Burkholderiales bacterium]